MTISQQLRRRALHYLTIPCIIGGQSHAETKVYVSPQGNDLAEGSIEQPLASLGKARDLVRKKRNNDPSSAPATIILRGGSYSLNETLRLEPQDSNTTWRAHNDETPVISGGAIIKGWTKMNQDLPEISEQAKGRIWKARIQPGWRFHYLFVDGQRAQRSMSTDAFWRKWPKDHTIGKPDTKGQLVTFKNKNQLSHLPSNGDAEFVCIIAQYGVMGNGVVTDVNPEKGTIRWNSKLLNLRNSRHGGERGYRFENALCLIDQPGEWAVDSEQGVVYYWPNKGEDLNSAQVIAPRLNRLVHIQGQEDQQSLVHKVNFKGITFAYTDRLPENQWPDHWLCRQWENVDASLYFSGTEDCSVRHCRILHSGSYGITINHHGQGNAIEHSEIGYTGSGGIFLEGYGPGNLDVNKHNHIAYNYIHDHGLGNYWHSPSIQIYQSGHNTIHHNLLQRSAYSSISMVGMHYKYMSDKKLFFPGTRDGQWHAWNYFCARPQDFPKEIQEGVKNGTYRFNRETMKPYMHSRNNLIEKNVISEPHSKLNEGGALYAWCTGKDNVWRKNVIFKSRSMPGSSILALDDIAEYFTIEDNVFWINGKILDGVGARGTERGNTASGNIRVNFRKDHQARRRGNLNKWWVNVSDRAPLDKLLNEIRTEVSSKGGWPTLPEIGIPSEGETITKYGEEITQPKGSHVTIEE
ncbi:right-handed parallel beta-helix repeat-containing protein [Verrucomicrobiaceae bacterium N1E253]|uniref:Right-handed parallel beta-helix repeat-containing protein n=1 Tax=Oceaniferula marina TaxID=2748318 RepID=A0A851GJ32_9BACT|nr:right-handed parallel beta-helix repeat-containing protein [Oceaniferula marina]NWK57346.1 right-handed parallel beta-helix repeat-containing protein [Oceaniferula marina]